MMCNETQSHQKQHVSYAIDENRIVWEAGRKSTGSQAARCFLWLAVMNACILIGLLLDCFCSSELKAEPLDLDRNLESFSSDEASNTYADDSLWPRNEKVGLATRAGAFDLTLMGIHYW